MNQLKEQLKIKNALLQALNMQITNSPYNRSNADITRKKRALLQEIETLERKIKEQVLHHKKPS